MIVAFIGGMIVGQLMLLVVVQVLFLRGPIDLRRHLRRTKQNKGQRCATDHVPLPISKPATISLTGDPGTIPLDGQILQSVGYDPSVHSAESLDWLTVLLAQFISTYRHSAEFHKAFSVELNRRLNSLGQGRDLVMTGGADSFEATPAARLLDNIKILSIDLGQAYPALVGAKVGYSETGTLRTELAFEWCQDQISLSLEAQVNLNWPVEFAAALPVQLSISVVRFKGTLAVEFGRAPFNYSSNGITVPVLLATFLPDLDIEFDVRSLIGHKTKLKDLPKITELLSAILRTVIEEDMVWPNFRQVSLPIVRGAASTSKS